jgi:ABC-2 type transport system permease protein
MGLLLGNPISKTHIVVEKTIAMVTYSMVLGVISFAATWVGVLLGGLDLSGWDIAATSALLTLLGLAFGALALVIGAATGRSHLASAITAGVAVAAYFVWSFFPLSASFEGWAVVSPFHYYLGSDPLVNGMDWTDAAVLAAVFLALVAISPRLWERRDLRG